MAKALIACSFALAYFILPLLASSPFIVNTSAKAYGPDGPWNAVEIVLGSDQQHIDVFPGGLSGSWILTKSACSNGLQCGAGGVFNPSSSTTFFNSSVGEPYTGSAYEIGALALTTTVFVATDTLSLQGPASNNEKDLSVSNFSLSLMPAFDMTFPSGAGYPLQAGQLSLGAFANFSLQGTGNTNVIPGVLASEGQLPSSSFGLHYGSAALKQPLSLWLGGYDQQRVIGTVSSQPVDGDQQFQIDLLDIGVNVTSGVSPFNPPAQQGLLAKDNGTIGTSPQPVWITPGSPYLFLPNSTCTAITANLPVTYNSTFSLYIWDTSSPDYNRILTSPSYLSFTFRLNVNSSANFTINVPFMLLNLTLDTTLVNTPTQYFPCQEPHLDGRYSLGRAFLQAAFLGANWDKTPQEWYLAQAPGPNIASQPSSVPFPLGALSSSPNLWTATWDGHWTPLAGSANGASGSQTASGGPTAISSGLSGGAIAGIVIGALVGLALIVSVPLAVLCYRRRSRRSYPTSDTQPRRALSRGGRREFKSELAHEGHERRVYEIADSKEVPAELVGGGKEVHEPEESSSEKGRIATKGMGREELDGGGLGDGSGQRKEWHS